MRRCVTIPVYLHFISFFHTAIEYVLLHLLDLTLSRDACTLVILEWILRGFEIVDGGEL